MNDKAFYRTLIASLLILICATFLIASNAEKKARVQETEIAALTDTVLYLIETTQENKNAN